MRFDVIVTNPPFHDITRRGKTPHKLWIEFTRLALEQLLAEHGVLCQISPSSFRSPNSPVLALMKRFRTPLIRLDTGQHFPGVGSTFADYTIFKEPRNDTLTRISSGARVVNVALDEHLFYIPNDLTSEGISIHRKVMFRPRSRLPVEWDYVTCHNIHARDGSETLSRSRTDRHSFPVFHTNSQVWWSSLRQDWASDKKVMWTRSGYTRPFYDPGTLGGTDMAYFVRVQSEDEGINLAHNMNLSLMRYIYESAKWSGFGNERVFAALPGIPRDRRLTDMDLFRMFSLTEKEIRHLYQRRLPDTPLGTEDANPLWREIAARLNAHEYMAGVTRTAERIGRTAEVFTPTPLVIEMVRSIPLERFAPAKTVLDPACGDGQFLAAAKWIKVLHHGMGERDAGEELFGVDLMRDNVNLCRRRVGGGTIVMGNVLRPEESLDGQTDLEADFIRSVFAVSMHNRSARNAARLNRHQEGRVDRRRLTHPATQLRSRARRKSDGVRAAGGLQLFT